MKIIKGVNIRKCGQNENKVEVHSWITDRIVIDEKNNSIQYSEEILKILNVHYANLLQVFKSKKVIPLENFETKLYKPLNALNGYSCMMNTTFNKISNFAAYKIKNSVLGILPELILFFKLIVRVKMVYAKKKTKKTRNLE